MTIYKKYVKFIIVIFWLSPSILIKIMFSGSSAFALVQHNQNLVPVSVVNTLIASRDFSKSSKSMSKTWDKANNVKSAVPLNSISNVVADVIPIEDYKVKPPPTEKEDDTLHPSFIKPSTLNNQEKQPGIQQNSSKHAQEVLIQKLRQSKKTQQEQQKTVLDALTVSSLKYPWIVNPIQNFGLSTQLLHSNSQENYINTDIHFIDTQKNQNFIQFNYANFPKSDQFYWVLNDNKIVIETKGVQTGILYQGRATDTKIVGNLTSKQALWGLQYISAIPVDFKDLAGKVETHDVSVTSIAGQLINPEGKPAGKVVINSGINLQGSNVTVLKSPTSTIGSGSTSSSNGGQSLFQSLDSTNTPLILQGFPTTNLQPLLDGGNVRLAKGEIIPNDVLEASGIVWGDVLTGVGFNFTAPISSLPGIKIAQLSKFDNKDLLNLAVNPNLSQTERDSHYLNSLLWVSLGKSPSVFQTTSETQNTHSWHRFYVSYPHNRSLIQYDKVAPIATYSNIFSNPGLSITANFSEGSIDDKQTANASLGMLLGGIFDIIQLDKIDQSLQEARRKFKNKEEFAPLSTQPTVLQKRQINYRLNRTLAYANSASSLEQVSGNITFPSKITPYESTVFQVRTGNSKRAVQFLERDIKILHPGDTYFSNLSLSNEKFSPLSFISVPIPLNDTSITPINESSAAEVILTNSNGKQFVQQFSSGDTTTVPINIHAFDSAFDYMELTRVDQVGVRYRSFNGYLSLPTIELLAAGSSGNFNYSASIGTWFNIDANSVANVSNNNLGLSEPTVGVYTNVLLNYMHSDIKLNSQKKPVAIDTHIPFLKINWNSESNKNNPFSTFLSYYFEHQEKNLGYSLSPGIAFIQDNQNGNCVGLLNQEFSTSQGLNIKTNLEIGKEAFFELQGLQKVSKNISFGAYLRNYALNNLGLNTRVSGLNYGAIIRQAFPSNSIALEAQIGTGDNGFDFRLQSDYRF
jgi:hypothetical protein